MLKEIKRLLKMHRIFIAQDLKKLMEYKVDFLTGMLGFIDKPHLPLGNFQQHTGSKGLDV